jgi:hypothetical protein
MPFGQSYLFGAPVEPDVLKALAGTTLGYGLTSGGGQCRKEVRVRSIRTRGMRDSSGQVGQVLLQPVAQWPANAGLHRKISMIRQPAAVNGIDHMIEVIVKIRMIHQQAQSMGMFRFLRSRASASQFDRT